MAKRKRETIWSFEKEVKISREALVENRRLTNEIEFYRTGSVGQTPQAHSGLLAGSIGVERLCELFCLLADIDAVDTVGDEVWRRLHIVWRYDAFEFYVYINRLEQLARENPEKARAGTLRIGDVDAFLATHFLMNLAFSVVVGENKAADWLGQKCLAYFTDPPPYVTDAYTLGPVAPFLLKLYGLWRGIPVDLASRGITLLKPFQDIIDTWYNPEGFEEAFLKLCELHAWKAVNYDLADNDLIFGLQSGHHKDLPSELLFIQRIRCDLGLSVPDPDHPLLRSPLARMPYPCPKSGYDPWLADSLAQVRKDMPDLHIEWEEEYQKLGPTDPRRLPETDFPNDKMKAS